jgi:hypothetical protein
MLLRFALVCATVGSCRTPSARPIDDGPADAQAPAAAAQVSQPAGPSPAVVVAAPASPPAAPAPAAPAPAAPAPVVADDDDEGCIAHVDELPAAPWLDRDDRRLSRDDLVVVLKSARRLLVFDDGVRTSCWKIALGFAPSGHKEVQGDGKTPEGWYRTSDKPWSTFDNAIAIHYPNAVDARAGAAAGRITRRTRDKIEDAIEAGRVPPQSTALGGAILIHGGGTSFDWTLGCVALDDADLLALRERLPNGMRTDVLVLP